MQSIGINPDKDFKDVIFAGGHDASVLAVGAKKVHLGATWEGPYQRAIEAGLIKPEDVIVIWKSDGIPRSPVAVRGDLSTPLVQKIQQAFIAMPDKAPEAMKQYETMWDKNKYYVAVDDSAYDFIRTVAKGLGKID
jgi:phosphonate transport system substrate-binding protein